MYVPNLMLLLKSAQFLLIVTISSPTNMDDVWLVTGASGRSNIIKICMKNLVAILLVVTLACKFNHAVQGCQKKDLTVFEKYTA